jgi:hypothetical protein
VVVVPSLTHSRQTELQAHVPLPLLFLLLTVLLLLLLLPLPPARIDATLRALQPCLCRMRGASCLMCEGVRIPKNPPVDARWPD